MYSLAKILTIILWLVTSSHCLASAPCSLEMEPAKYLYGPLGNTIAAQGFLAVEGEAARFGSLTPAQAQQIQALSDKFGAAAKVVGSRAAGTAGPFSDFDNVIGGNSSLRHSAERFLPKNPQSVMGNEAGNLPFRGIDIIKCQQNAA